MRFLIYFCALSIISTAIFSKENLLLHCLAKEEENFHKLKEQTVVSKLNQDFINELATSNDISIKKNYVDEICQKNASFPPAIGFLRLLLLKENDIFDLSLSGVDPNMRSYKMAYIREFQKQVPHIFITYLAGIQLEMPDAHCLEKAIPEISTFNERLKYLEEEITIHEILQKKQIDAIFNKLKKLQTIKANCGKNPLRTRPEKKPILKF